MINYNINNCKIILIGSSYVGKTSIIESFVYNSNNDVNLESSKGLCFYAKDLYIKNCNLLINFDLWDTASINSLHSLNKMFFRKINIIILVYSIDDITTLEEIKNYYNNELKDYCCSNTGFCIVANKSDKTNDFLIENINEGINFSNIINGDFYKISSFSNDDIIKMFLKIGEDYLNKKINFKNKYNNNNNKNKDKNESFLNDNFDDYENISKSYVIILRKESITQKKQNKPCLKS